jgi:hypothetical protein
MAPGLFDTVPLFDTNALFDTNPYSTLLTTASDRSGGPLQGVC